MVNLIASWLKCKTDSAKFPEWCEQQSCMLKLHTSYLVQQPKRRLNFYRCSSGKSFVPMCVCVCVYKPSHWKLFHWLQYLRIQQPLKHLRTVTTYLASEVLKNISMVFSGLIRSHIVGFSICSFRNKSFASIHVLLVYTLENPSTIHAKLLYCIVKTYKLHKKNLHNIKF